MFATNSRYAGLATYTVTLPDGSTVDRDAAAAARTRWRSRAITAASSATGSICSPARYLKDPTCFWKLCDSNNAPVARTRSTRAT